MLSKLLRLRGRQAGAPFGYAPAALGVTGRELSAGRYLRSAYREGQVISVDGVRGEIVAMETAATVLRTPAGDTVRLPNAMLLSSVVTVHDPGA